MQEKKIIAGLYPRVSTEDQSRYGHSLDEQEDRLNYYNNVIAFLISVIPLFLFYFEYIRKKKYFVI